MINLLDAAIGELDREGDPARSTVLKAASLLRQQIGFRAAPSAACKGARLLEWEARRLRAYIDEHLASPIRVEDLSVLIRRSEAYFARVFKRSFGISPHAFVVRRRLELAARCMLNTDASLSEIALQFGFADQAHFCKLFRQSLGETPAAWRRARTSQVEPFERRSQT